MKAIIMAGGNGSRLRPLTCTKPKPMANIFGKPLLEHITELLKKHGIRDIGITLRYLPESIKSHFGDGKNFGVNITYFTENEPLGTAGAVFAARDFLDDDFLIISGDALCDFNLSSAIDFHKRNKAEATLMLYSMDIPIEYGVVATDESGKIRRFLEKPDWSRVLSDTVNTGIYILSKSVFSGFSGGNFDFSKDVFPKLLSQGRALYGYRAEGYWCDIGDIDVFRHCHFDVFNKKIKLSIAAREIKPGVFAGEGAQIDTAAVINAPAFIGRGCKIHGGAFIDSYSVIGDGTEVKPYATIKRSVTGGGCIIGENAQIRGAVLCDRCILRRGSAVFEQSVIGEGTLLGENSKILPGVKIWPYKDISDNKTVNANVVWENGRRQEIFGENGISGDIGFDITPCTAVLLGAALCKTSENGKTGVSSDGEKASVMIKNALVSGLMSCGGEIFDFGEQPLPITRCGVRFYGLSAGVHIESFGGKVRIRLINDRGADLTAAREREIRLLLDRADFSYSHPSDIKEIRDLYEYKLHYLRELIGSVQNKKIGMNILLVTPSAWAERLLFGAAADLGFKIKVIKRDTDFSDSDMLSEFAKDVKRGYDFGAMTDKSGESIILADSMGRIIDKDMYKVLASLIIMKKYGGEIVSDVSAPSVLETLSEKYGASLKRAGVGRANLMAEISKNFPAKKEHESFMLLFDAVGAVIKILDFLKTENLSLRELYDEMPEFCVLRKEIKCDNADKGKLMRELSALEENTGGDTLRLSSKNGYVLVIPHSSKPVCKMIIEAKTQKYANELAEDFTGRIQDILKRKR